MNTSFLKTLEEIEVEYITHVLKICGGNVTATAKTLDISRATLNRKIKEYKIDVEKIRKRVA